MGLFLFYPQMRTDIHSRMETQQPHRHTDTARHSFSHYSKRHHDHHSKVFAHAALESASEEVAERTIAAILRTLAVAAHRMKVIKIFVEQTDNVWYFTWSNVNCLVWPRKRRPPRKPQQTKNHFIDLYVAYAIMYTRRRRTTQLYVD